MKKFRVDNSKFHLFIHKPTKSYVAVEKDTDVVFAKFLVIYDKLFEKISDEHVTHVHFLSYHKDTNSYFMTRENPKSIKMNELKDLPGKIKISIKIQELLGF